MPDSATILDPAAALDRDGYVLLKSVIPTTITDALSTFLYAKLGEYQDVFRERTGVALEDITAVKTYVDALTAQEGSYPRLDKDLQHLVRGEFPLFVRLSPQVLSVTAAAALIHTLRSLLGEPALRMHYPPMARFKTPHQEQVNVPMHQDCAYNTHLGEFLTVWTPLCPITDACGGVDVLVGSHRLGPLPHRQQVIWGNYVDPRGLPRHFASVHVAMQPGDALVFGPLTLHASHPNTSRVTRCSIDYRFFMARTSTPKHYYDLTTQRVVTPAGT